MQFRNNITYSNGCLIQLLNNNTISVKIKDKAYRFDDDEKPIFDHGNGETVVEYTGLATDGNKNQSWAKASYTPDSYSSLHYHTERTEDYYIISGHAQVIISGVEHILSQGDHVQILPNQHHQVFNSSKTEKLLLIVSCSPAWCVEDNHQVKNICSNGFS